MKCRICRGTKFTKLFSLGKQALANNLLKKKGKTKKYPLTIVQCTNCTLIQLNYVVPKEEMYDEYFYIPSVSQMYLHHFNMLAYTLVRDIPLKKKSLVVDIGSSDGSLLRCFEKIGMKVVGVEAAKNITAKVKTYRQYFNGSLARKLVAREGKAKLVTATNSFAHIDDLQEYLKALDILLDEDGVFFAQFPDVRNLLKENQFDTIYHEHLSYFSYESLHYLFAKSPFEIYNIENSPIHGGSMRIYVRRRKPLIKNFISSAATIKEELTSYLTGQKAQGERIVAFGAAAKGMVLLQYCGLDDKVIDFVVDGTPYKQGKFTPGTNIPIVEENVLILHKVDIILILAWNFKEEIMEKLKGKGYIFVVPIPYVQIYDGKKTKARRGIRMS